MRIKKSSVKKVKNCGRTIIFKRDDKTSKYYYVRIGVSKKIRKSGWLFESLEESNLHMALIKAVQVWERHLQGKTKHNKTLVQPEMRISYFGEFHFQKYKNSQLDKVGKSKSILEANREIQNEENRLHKVIYPYFDNGNKDISKITYEELNDFLNVYLINGNLNHRARSKKRSNKTRKGYRYLIQNIFQQAIIKDAISKSPVVPQITGVDDVKNWEPYEDSEIALIRDEFRNKEKISGEDSFSGSEMIDIINWLRFVPVRSGKEWIFLQHKHMEIVNHIKDGKILVINIPHRKIAKNRERIICKKIALNIYENRILKRTPNITGEEYLFLNHLRYLNPSQLQKKFNFQFVTASKKLKLYRIKNDEGIEVTRPPYSLRPTQFVEDVSLPNSDIETIAINANTSPKMLRERYLKKYSAIKKSEIYDKLNKGRGSGNTPVTHNLKKRRNT